jgi:hypothetical protein
MEDVLGHGEFSVASVKCTKTQTTQKQFKKSKPHKKEHGTKLQLAKNNPPRAGTRPIVKMYISVPGQEIFCIWPMFDTGAAIPIISSMFIKEHSLPIIKWGIPLRINGADGCVLSGAGQAFSHSLMLQHK